MTSLIVSVLFGIAALVLAVKKGRSPLWFFAGFMFSVLGVLVVLVLPDLSRMRYNTTTTSPPPSRPETRAEDYIPPSIQKEDYKSKSVDIGYEIYEDDME